MNSSEGRGRAAVVLRDGSRVALIKRMRDGRTHFGFPGAGIHVGELPAETAVRGAREELGVEVVLGPRVLIEQFRGETIHYFSALTIGGEFGAATREELEPVWMEISELPHYDVRPRALAAILTGS